MSPSNPIIPVFNSGQPLRARWKLKSTTSLQNQVEPLIERLRERARKEFPDSTIQVGGMGATTHMIHNKILHELIFEFWHALIVIVALLLFVFRSLRWALLSPVH